MRRAPDRTTCSIAWVVTVSTRRGFPDEFLRSLISLPDSCEPPPDVNTCCASLSTCGCRIGSQACDGGTRIDGTASASTPLSRCSGNYFSHARSGGRNIDHRVLRHAFCERERAQAAE